jgi:DNA-binding NtrC family response regulator
VGGAKELTFEGRIISATNVNLKEKSEIGLFREDLYFRLSILSITMPTLVQRIQDIPILCEHFINKANKELKTSITSISQEALAILKKNPWKGNIRELRNTIYSACLNARSEILKLDDMSLSQKNNSNSIEDELKKIIKLYIDQYGIAETKNLQNIMEKIFLETCLEICPNISQLASYLGIARNTLKKKLLEFELDKDKL